MKSAGNDIVALTTIDIQRTTSASFYLKFITVAEQELYRQPQLAAVSFVNFIWLLWSVKESAYKYFKRGDPSLVFSPTKIVVKNISAPQVQKAFVLPPYGWESDPGDAHFYSGEVVYGAHKLFFRSIIADEFIASTVCSEPDFKEVYWGIHRIENADYQQQSQEVRSSLLKKLEKAFGLDKLRVAKSPSGYPVILQDNTPLDIQVSLAHHEHFVSYSFLMGL